MKWAVHPDPSTRRRLPESEEASACRRSIGQAWRCPMLALALSITSSSESQNSRAVSRSLQYFADPCRTSQNMRNFRQLLANFQNNRNLPRNFAEVRRLEKAIGFC